MKIPENLTEVQNGTIVINETSYRNMVIDVIPGKLSENKYMNFTWKLVNYTTLGMKI